MPLTSLDTQIRSRVAAFADELAKLVKVATLEAVVAALEGHTPSRRSPTVARPTREAIETAGLPSLVDYERAAVQRALAEVGGDAVAAGGLLGMSRSAVYRVVQRYGFVRSAVLSAPRLGAELPLSLDAYEKAALQRALDAGGGDIQSASRLLGMPKSTAYRRMRVHGL